MKINPTNEYEYIYEATLFNQRTSFVQMASYFDVMMEQASAILETAGYEFVTEEVTVAAAKGVTNAGKKVVSGVKKFIDFIKNMFNRFIEFVTTLFKNNEKWLTEREKDFGNMNYIGLNISAVPYWEGSPFASAERILREIQGMVNDYSLLDSAKSLNQEELGKALEDTNPERFLSKYATNGDHIDGIKNILRVNNKDGKDAVKLEGDAIKARIQNFFIPTVKENKSMTDKVKKLVDANESTLNKIDNAITTRSVAKESFLLMGESLTVSEASLFLPVLEAEINADDKSNNSNAKDSTHGATNVTINKRSPEDKAEFEAVKGMSSNVLKITRNYAKCTNIVLAATLTVMEERMSLSMNVLKAVYAEANTRHGRKGNTEGKEKK